MNTFMFMFVVLLFTLNVVIRNCSNKEEINTSMSLVL